MILIYYRSKKALGLACQKFKDSLMQLETDPYTLR